MQIKIRTAEKKDGEKICAMLCDIGALHHNGRPDIYRGNLQKYGIDEYNAILADEKMPILVAADKNDTVVGYAFLVLKEVRDNAALVDRRYVYVDDFCVDKNVRRGGVGRTLMNGVFDFARSLGYDRVELNVWEFNKSALLFYESLGMTTQKRQMEIKL